MWIQIWNEDRYDSFPVRFAMVTTRCQVRVGMTAFFIVHMIDMKHHIHCINKQAFSMDFLASLINIDPGIRIEIRFVDQSAQFTGTILSQSASQW